MQELNEDICRHVCGGTKTSRPTPMVLPRWLFVRGEVLPQGIRLNDNRSSTLARAEILIPETPRFGEYR